MQVKGTSQAFQQTQHNTQLTNKKTDEFLFEQNNKKQEQIVSLQADLTRPLESKSAPAIIGAMLTTFADEIINLLGGETPEFYESPDNEYNPDKKVTPTQGATNFIA